MEVVRVVSFRSMARRTVPALAIVAALLAASGGFADATPTAASPHPAGPVPGAWASFSGIGVTVVFPSTLPVVDLFNPSNASQGASLALEGLLELAPSQTAHPVVVAAALPTQIPGFNTTSTPGVANAPVTLSAALAVRHVGVGLWSTTGVGASLGPSVGSATVDLSYTPVQGAAGGGLDVSWSVANWPWTSAGDLLALQLRLTMLNGVTVAPCATALALSLSPTCPGDLLDPVGIAWDSSISSVVGQGPEGLSASVAWEKSAQLGVGVTVPYTVGTFSSDNASADLVLGVAASGSDRLSGALAFTLATPALPAIPAVVHGDVAAYVGTALLGGTAALLGIGFYRRRERRLAAEL